MSTKQTKILRFGGIGSEKINELVKIEDSTYSKKFFISPGLSRSHYKPDKIRINASKPETEGWLAFGKLPKNLMELAITQ